MVDIWQELTRPRSLRVAFDKVYANHGVAGGNGVSVDDFKIGSGPKLVALSGQLREGIYQAGDCKQFLIPKKSGGTRLLMVPNVRDRIVHTAIANELTPLLEPLFENSSFAYRPGRSVKQAVAAIEHWRNAGFKHVIEADIKNYFDEICHDKLLKCLHMSLSHVSGIETLISFLTSEFAHQARQLERKERGLLQGSPLSPLLANLYLDVLDEEIVDRGVRIVRFADDFVILCKKITHAHSALEELQEILDALGLQLNMAKTRLVDFDKGFEFLGYLFVRSLAMKRESISTRSNVEHTRSKAIAPPDPKPIEIEPPAVDHADPREVISSRHATGDRVLYVMEKGRKVSADSQNCYVLTPESNEVMALPFARIDRIVLGRDVDLDRDFIDLCAANNKQLYFTNGRGEPLARLSTPQDNYPALQLSQAVACANPQSAAILTRKIVEARIRNQRTQLFRLNRQRKNSDVVQALNRMKYLLRKLPFKETVAQMRGIEGASGAEFWPVLAALCVDSSQPFKRTRPATDPLNAVINYLTFMLERDITSATRSCGLNCGFGFLHKPRDYSLAAVYDLMEPFRAPLNEGLAVYLFNAKRLRPEMFFKLENGKIRIDYVAQRAIITGYEQAVAKRVNVTGKKMKLSWRMMMKRQAVDLANAYRTDDLDSFQPYLMEA